ncbi:thiamine biosynthesis protein [Corynebacterium falsenii DSM 44353]|uniref:FAD:protein FMN transferase n=1 Tax=Corynebacterium falsenii TaxID=108486 RepID=UPI0003E94FF4|nr:FAD:protein FMN transferase [Corynebacterium falsenii]AHI02414.1 thiamine biosynthesis protein [Corynebacterium falsenii DSM 44353]UBI05190.1 FAD:protein FMN transferase [Corynebacterium falsenii]
MLDNEYPRPATSAAPTTDAAPACIRWTQWTCEMDLWVADGRRLADARTIVDQVLRSIDRACNRFDATSELSLLTAMASTRHVRTEVSDVLADLLQLADHARGLTAGLVDANVGRDVMAWGYGGGETHRDTSAPQYRSSARRGFAIDGNRLDLPQGGVIDLGAVAKPYAADWAATAAAEQCGCGVLVNLGGDIACAGASPRGGWRILVQDGADEPADSLTIVCGRGERMGVATSSTLHRRWAVDIDGARTTISHLFDPRTGAPASDYWRSVTAIAPTATEANVWTTAVVVQGAKAEGIGTLSALPVRLVRSDGRVTRSSMWPRAAEERTESDASGTSDTVGTADTAENERKAA